MANAITLNQKDLNLIDEIYLEEAKVASFFEIPAGSLEWIDAKTIRVNEYEITGLVDYDRTTDITKGDITITKQVHTLNRERAARFEVEALDSMENPVNTVAEAVTKHMVRNVVPENDAYTVSRIFDEAKTTIDEILTTTNILSAIDTASEQLDNDEVPMDQRILFVSPAINNLLKNASTIQRTYATNETQMFNGIDRRVGSLDGIPVVVVPRNRFTTEPVFNSGGGFTPGADFVNFVLADRAAVLNVLKTDIVQVVPSSANQTSFKDTIKHLIYGDTIVWTNSKPGLYVSFQVTI